MEDYEQVQKVHQLPVSQLYILSTPEQEAFKALKNRQSLDAERIILKRAGNFADTSMWLASLLLLQHVTAIEVHIRWEAVDVGASYTQA